MITRVTGQKTWGWVDTDHNDAVILIDAEPIFIVVENAFCMYFSSRKPDKFLLPYPAQKRKNQTKWNNYNIALWQARKVERSIRSLLDKFAPGFASSSTLRS